MAKKKAAAKKSPVKKTADKATTGVVAKPATPSSPKAKATAASSLTSEDIGHAAGAVWQALDASGPLTLAALKKATGLGGDLTAAGIGWLAREEKLHFDANGRSFKVSVQ